MDTKDFIKIYDTVLDKTMCDNIISKFILDENKNKQYVHQNSWGISTRVLGVMVMLHSDDKGLIIPPKVA